MRPKTIWGKCFSYHLLVVIEKLQKAVGDLCLPDRASSQRLDAHQGGAPLLYSEFREQQVNGPVIIDRYLLHLFIDEIVQLEALDDVFDLFQGSVIFVYDSGWTATSTPLLKRLVASSISPRIVSAKELVVVQFDPDFESLCLPSQKHRLWHSGPR